MLDYKVLSHIEWNGPLFTRWLTLSIQSLLIARSCSLLIVRNAPFIPQSLFLSCMTPDHPLFLRVDSPDPFVPLQLDSVSSNTLVLQEIGVEEDSPMIGLGRTGAPVLSYSMVEWPLPRPMNKAHCQSKSLYPLIAGHRTLYLQSHPRSNLVSRGPIYWPSP